MTLFILAAALCGWSYEGFAEDPSSSIPAPHATPAPAVPSEVKPAPTVPSDPPAVPKTPSTAPVVEARKRQPAATSIAKAPAPPRASVAPPAPIRWRLADASGQVWEHNDYGGLRHWVAERNAALSNAAAWNNRLRMPTSYGDCSSGACYRTR